ncbi:MAG: hypothetical protein VW397_02595 [Candidatus Margulisiibacteriota bacterium]
MNKKEQSNNNVKRIIDPKSGFSLYIRKFNDSEISQVSTLDTFPIPNDQNQINNQSEQMLEVLNGSLDDIKKENKKIMHRNEELILRITKQNNHFKLICLCLIIITFISIFI